MEYKLEEKSAVERRFQITVPAEEATSAVAATVAIYKTKADFKGFRKGKAPSSMVEAKFKSSIYEEATTDLINYHLNEILGETGLKPLSGLRVDAGLLEKNKEFVYSVEFEIAPAIDLPNYDGLTVKQEKVVIDKEEVEQVLKRMQDNMAEQVEITEDRLPEDGDTVIISFNAWQEGKAMDEVKAENFQLVLGEGQALKDFEDIVKTLKTGEKGEGEVTFPDDFLNEELAGQTVTMHITLHAIKKKIMPELNKDFAAMAGGFNDMDALKKAIEESYQTSRTNLVKSAAQKSMMDELLGQTDFPLPPAMVKEQAANLAQNFVKRLESQGKRLEAIGKTLQELQDELSPQAEEQVATQLLLLAIAEKEDLSVTDEDIDMHIYREAMEHRQSPETVRRFYEDNNLMFALKDRLTCDKAVDLVYARATVEEVDREEPEKGKQPEPDKPKKETAKKAAPKKKTTKKQEKEGPVKKAAPGKTKKETTAKKAASEKAEKKAAPKKTVKKPAAKDD